MLAGSICAFEQRPDRKLNLQAISGKNECPEYPAQSSLSRRFFGTHHTSHMDEIIAGVLGFLVRQTGRVAVWLVSFGRWRGEQLLGDEGRIHGAAGALSFVRDGRRVITNTGLLFFDITFYVVLFLIAIAYVARA